MEGSDARRVARAPEVPRWLRTIGIGLGVMLVPPFVIPIVLLVMGMGMLAFLPFLPFLLGEFYYAARNTAVSDAKSLERELFTRRHHRPRHA